MLCRLLAVQLLAVECGLSQTAALDAGAGHPLAFGVVSVRLNKADGLRQFGATPDGYRVTNMVILLPIITAYVPTSGNALFAPDSVSGMPEWARQEHYDIDAKVAEADVADWQKPTMQPAMLRAMLQAMLKDRFKLVVHREMKEVQVYELVVGKGGPKLKESTPGEPHPNGRRLPGGDGVMVMGADETIHFYETPMATLAPVLSDLTGRSVQDKTGLTGKYDFAMPRPPNEGVSAAQPGAGAADPGPTVFSILEDLGLKLVPAKASVETLVIDHVERPSEN